jgi:tripartite-type tricarboxylate transporter receptor subunit TctC
MRIRALFAGILVLFFAMGAAAQIYPSRPVRMIVPFASGGGSDTVGRVISQALSASLGQGFVVENRTGAGGAIGAEAVAKRAPSLPSTPTLQEAGVKGYDTTLWTGILAPAGTPPEIVAKLNAETVAALARPEVKDALNKQGAEPIPSTPGEFAAAIRTELQTMGKLVREAGIWVE